MKSAIEWANSIAYGMSSWQLEKIERVIAQAVADAAIRKRGT